MDKLETYIRKAYLESSRGERKGDKWEEVEIYPQQ